MIFKWLAQFLTAPIIGGFIDAYKAKLSAGNTHEQIAADLAGRELVVQQREIELQTQLRIAQIGRWYEPEHLMAYILTIYFGTAIIWDKVLGDLTHHSTDALGGDVAQWAGMLMAFLFGKRGIENVARIIRR